MDPQSYQDQGISLPQPQPGGAATMPLPTSVPQQPASQSPWQTVAVPLATSGLPVPPQAPPVAPLAPVAPATAMLQPTVPVHPMDTPTTASDAQQLTGSDTAAVTDLPSEAADSDIIEKEWVIKAKQVVSETRSDPYKQVRELNKLKADYMKKRYNKELKLPDA